MRKLVIIHKDTTFSPAAVTGGAERALLGMADAIQQLGCTVQIMGKIHPPFEPSNGVSFVDIGNDYSPEIVAGQVPADAETVICVNRADVLREVRRRGGSRRCVLWLQDSGMADLGADAQTVGEAVDGIVYVSAAQQAFYEKAQGLSPRATVVHNGFIPAVFQPRPAAVAPYRLVYSGAMVPEKGIFELLEALAQVRAAGTEVELWVYGSAGLWGQNERPDLKALAARYPFAQFKGLATQAELCEAYNGALAAVVSSLPSRRLDPFPLTSIEAQACGCPAIVTRSGGLPESVIPGETGFILEGEAPRQWAEQFVPMLAELRRRPEMRQRCAARATQEFQWAALARQFLSFVNGLEARCTERQMALSVIIPTLNRAPYLRRSIGSLLEQTLPAEEYEILVVDDGSTDGTREVCESFAADQRFRYVSQTNQGISAAKNRGIELARGNAVLFFDDDDVADPQLLAEHARSHAQWPQETVAVLGHTSWHNSLNVDPFMEFIVGKGAFLFSYVSLQDGHFYDYTCFWGGRSSCKRSLLQKHGVFNPVFTFGSEDIELGYRLSRQGLKVLYNAKARSYMIREVDFDSFLARCQRQGKSQVWFSRLHSAPEIQKWCQVSKAAGIWEFLKTDFERNVSQARLLLAEMHKLCRLSHSTALPANVSSEMVRLRGHLESVLWQALTAAKYKGLVEELQRQPAPAAVSCVRPAGATGKKRVLFMDLYIPVFNRASGCLRAFQLLKMLRELDYEVTFLSKYPQFADEYAPYLEAMGVEVIAGDPVAVRATGGFAVCPLVHYERLFGGRRWDLAVVAFWDNAEYYLPLLRQYAPGTPVVVDTVDIVFLRKIREAELSKDPKAMAEALANKKREINVYRQADRLWVVTEADQAAVQEYVPGMPIDVLSNIHPPVAEHKTYAGTRDLLFVGNFWHTPNVDAMAIFCEYVFPRIRQQRPDITLQVVGDNVPPLLRKFESEAVRFLGHVPDLAPVLRSARVSVAPLRYGAGMKGKIGEALSWGLPVVTTNIGAEGMALLHEETAMIADTPAAFAEAVLRLYEDEELWSKLSRNGKAHVESYWGYEVVKARAAAAVNTALAAKPLASIIILVLNQLEHTRKCLDSIAACTKLPHQVIVVDNGSTDGTPEFLKQWQVAHANCVVIRNESNRGFAAGNNQGLSVAQGDYLVLLNNDTVVTDGWLEGMLDVLERHPHTGLIGPMSNCVSGPQLVPQVGYQTLSELPQFAARFAQEHCGKSLAVPRAVGFCLLLRRAVVERLGGLDERFGSGNFEDDDYCIRALLAGFEIRLAQGVFIHHTGSQTFKGARIDYRQAMLRNWSLFKAKWQLPDHHSVEQGYFVPTVLPQGVALKIELPNLLQSHAKAASSAWWKPTAISVAEHPGAGAAAQHATRVPATVPLPACARLGELSGARELLARKQWAGAWETTLKAISQRPFHPEAWLLLAQIALAVGDSTSARRCAQHARELAPDYKAAKKFLNGKLQGNTKPAWLVLPEPLAAQNAKGKVQGPGWAPRLSVCLIVRNEEKFLGQCLQSIRGLASQIILVDTGSTDRTVEIAKEHGAEVHHFTWCDDFSAARNAALEQATGDWVLMLDADEELPPESHHKLRKLLQASSVMAWRLPIIDVGREAEGCCYVPRLFRNAPGLFYTGRIHEQVFGSVEACRQAWGLENRLGDAALRHHGYRPEVAKDRNKVQRNLQLLEKALQETPADANLLMNYGLELVRSGNAAAGLEQYRRAFQFMSVNPAAVPAEMREMLLTQFATQLMAGKGYTELVCVLTSPLAKAGGLTASLHFSLGLAYTELKDFPAAAEQMRQCLAKRHQSSLAPINLEIRKAGPQHCLAVCLGRAGQVEAAKKAFAQALREEPQSRPIRLDYAEFVAAQGQPVEALQLFHALATEQPQDPQAWRLGGQLALSRPEFLEVALDWSATAQGQLPEDRVLLRQRAEALTLAGQCAAALPLWQQLYSAPDPETLAPLVLCESVAGLPQQSPEARFESQTSGIFLKWYQRLLQYKAGEAVQQMNQKLDQLEKVLPSATKLLRAALQEAAV